MHVLADEAQALQSLSTDGEITFHGFAATEALPDPTEDATEGLRHDVNNLTHFVDRLSIRCEDFFRRNAGLEEARKREMHDEERRAAAGRKKPQHTAASHGRPL